MLKQHFVSLLLFVASHANPLLTSRAPASWDPSSGNHLQRGHQVQNGQHPRLSLVEWDQYNERDVQGPDTYAFGYDVQDPETDNIHFRHEERLPNGTVVGSYGFVTPDGNAHVVKYVADHRGYRANVETTRRLMADVKPIPVNVDQDLADEIHAATLQDKLQQQQQFVMQQQQQNDDIRTGSSIYELGNTNRPPKFAINNRKINNYHVQGNLAKGTPQVSPVILPYYNTYPIY